MAFLFRSALGVFRKHPAFFRQLCQHHRVPNVTQVFELGNGEQAIRPTRISGNETKIAVFGVHRRERQEMFRLLRLAVLAIDAQEGNIKVIAWEVEVIGIATKKCNLELRCEHQTDILIAAIFIEVEMSAVVEGNDITAQFGGGGTGVFQLGNFGSLHRIELAYFSGFGCVLDDFGDVGNFYQLIQFNFGTFHFIASLLGPKTGLDEILFRGGQLLDAGMRAMMIGHHQAIW